MFTMRTYGRAMGDPHPALAAIEGHIREAGEHLRLADGIIETVIHPRRVFEVSIPYTRADGSRGHTTGWRVQHNTTRGPAKGACAYTPRCAVTRSSPSPRACH